MNFYTKTFLVALVAGSFALFSCGTKSAVNCGSNFAGDLQSQTNALSTTLTAYSNDPSNANCEKYKDALEDYFNAFEGLRGCYGIGASKQAFDEAIKDAKDSLDDWEC
jgi:hypothetical protein